MNIDKTGKYWDIFREQLYDAGDEEKIDYDYKFGRPLYKVDVETEQKAHQMKIPESIIEIYNYSDGFEHTWTATHNTNIGGNMHFLRMKHVLQDWKKAGLYYDDDLLQNDLLEYYKLFDMISETYSCGILITPNFVSQSIYCHNAPEPQLYALDIDFEGYMEMAKEARIFQYWPKVLLDIKAGSESPETTTFKNEMPKIFKGFDWQTFVDKYESLRLSKKAKPDHS